MSGAHTIDRWIRDRARTTPEPGRDRLRGAPRHLPRARRGLRRVRGRVRRGRAEPRRPGGDADRRARPSTSPSSSPARRPGSILLPLSWRLSPAELRYQLDDAEPSLFLVEAEYEELAAADRPRASPVSERPSPERPGPGADRRDLARRTRTALLLVYTSGTTGKPKGALAHARELLLDEPRLRPRQRRLRPDDVVLQVLPQFHVGGWNVQALLAWLEGRAASCSSASSSPARALRLIEEKRVTTMMGVPRDLPVHGAGARLRRRRPLEPAARGRRRRADAGGAARDVGRARRRDRPGLRADRGRAERPLPAARGRRPQDRLRAGKPYPFVEVRLSAGGRAAGARPERVRRLLAQPRGDRSRVHAPTAGCAPATSPSATTRASTGSRAGSRTCTSPAARTSTRPRSRRCSTSTRPSRDAAVVGVPDERWGEVGVAFVVADGVRARRS